MEDRNKANSQRKYKFIRRSLTCKSYNMSQAIFAQTRVKRFYFKELDEMGFDSDRPYYSKGKQISCLTKIKTELKCKSHYLNLARKAINLKSVEIEVPFTNSLRNTLSFIKRLSKNVEVFIISGTQNITTAGQIRSLYNNLYSFPKLKLVKRYIAYSGEKGRFIEQECQKINQCLSRKKQPINFYYQQSETCQPGLQRILMKDQSCPYINDLSLILTGSSFENFNAVEGRLNIERSDGEEQKSQGDEEWTDDDDEEEEEENEEDSGNNDFHDDYEDEDDGENEIGDDVWERQGNLEENEEDEEEDEEMMPRITQEDEAVIKKEMVPFFKFHLLPNLRKLDLNFMFDCLYPLDSFVVEGFKSLQKLEELRLILGCRPEGTKYLFEGLLELPLLAGFSLEIPFIKGNEDELLTQFLQKQTKLVFLSIEIESTRASKATYAAQNLCLENMCQHLDQPNLRYLTLKAKSWTLESLSKGLKKTSGTNQLQELEIGIFDDYVTSSLSPYDRVEGLCNFLKNHKRSLRSLTITLQFVGDDVIIDSLVKTISELEELKKLSLQINDEVFASNQEYKDFFRMVYSHKFPKDAKNAIPSFSQTFQELDKTLRKLKKLSNLDLFLNFLQPVRPTSSVNSLKILDGLSGIDTLRGANLYLPYLKESVKKYPRNVQKLLQIKNILFLSLKTHKYELVKEIESIARNINVKNPARSDLMFY